MSELYKYIGRFEDMVAKVVPEGVSFYIEMGNKYESADIVIPLEEARKLAAAIFRHYLFDGETDTFM